MGPVLGGLTVQLNLHEWGAVHAVGGPALVATLLAGSSAILNLFFFKETIVLKKENRVASQLWVVNPMSGLRKIGGNDFTRIVCLNLVYVFLFASYEFSFSFYFSLEYHLTALEIGFVFFYLGIWFVLGQGVLVRVLSKRWPPSLLLYTGLAMLPLPLALLGFMPHFSSLWLPLLLLIPITLGTSLVLASLSGLASLTAPVNKQGHAMGILRSFGSLGRAFAPLGGAPLYWVLGAEGAYVILALFLLGLFLYTFFNKKFRLAVKK